MYSTVEQLVNTGVEWVQLKPTDPTILKRVHLDLATLDLKSNTIEVRASYRAGSVIGDWTQETIAARKIGLEQEAIGCVPPATLNVDELIFPRN